MSWEGCGYGGGYADDEGFESDGMVYVAIGEHLSVACLVGEVWEGDEVIDVVVVRVGWCL